MSFAQMLRDAGPVFWVLLVLSVYVLYLFLLKLQILNRLGQDPTLLLTRVHAALMQHNLSGAQRLAQQKHPVANVIRAGLDRVPTGRESVVAAMNEAAVIEEARLMQGLNNLATVAQVAPMLGLLGTVLGMIQAFEVFSRSAAPGAHQLAAGISEALINTATGLIVAIAAYLMRNYLRNRAEAILLQVDRIREALPAWITEAELRHQGRLSGAPIPPYEPEEAWQEPTS